MVISARHGVRPRRTGRRLGATAGALLLVLGLTGCGEDTDPADPTRLIDTAEPTLTGPAEEDTFAPSPSPSDSTPAASPSRTSGSARPSGTAAFPPAVQPEHGGTYWAAAVTIAEDAEDPTLRAAVSSLREVGYDNQGGEDLDCLQGLREVLKLEGNDLYYVVAVLFKTQARARQFERAFGADLAGIGKVATSCLD